MTDQNNDRRSWKTKPQDNLCIGQDNSKQKVADMKHASDYSEFGDNLNVRRKNDSKNWKLLPDGFGFTEDTYQFRLPEFQPKRILDPRQALVYKDLRKNDLGKGQISVNKVITVYTRSSTVTSACERGIHSKTPNKTGKQTRAEEDDDKYRTLPATDGGSINSKGKQDIEEDRLIVTGIIRKTLPDGSVCAPDNFVFYNELKLKKSVGKRKVYIPHICDGKLENDEFGATLLTYEAKERDGSTYYRHFLVKIQDDGPAKQMGIEEHDEIVLLLGYFVPDVIHNDVQKLFNWVKVDGKTRFVLVIRRKRAEWIWMEISAILAPEEAKEEYPVVKKPEVKTLKDNCHQYSETRVFYKVPGTQFYLQINNGLVSVDIMNKGIDKTKVIWRRVFVCQADDTGEYKFEASLSNETKDLYITIDKMKNIVLNSEPQLFQMFGIADKVRFRANDMYLGYNRSTKQVVADVRNCEFQEFPVETGDPLDETDGRLDKTKVWTSNMTEDQTCGKVTNIKYTSQMSTDSGTGSLLSTQTSCESGSGLLLKQTSRDSGNYSLSPQITTDDTSPISDRLSEWSCIRYKPRQTLMDFKM